MEYELYHYGVKGMKWGVRKKRPDRLDHLPNDSKVTRKVKDDYNKLSDQEFMRKYSGSKDRYAKRVKKYGDPYMNSPLAKFGKKQEQKIVNKALKRQEALDKDIRSFEPHKNGIVDKKGRTLVTADEIKNIVRGLNEAKLNNISRTDMYEAGRRETKRVMKELSQNYTMSYNVTTKQYTLYDRP